MTTPPDVPVPHRVPKLGHKKSMFGCQRCRARRVKCNEEKPTCHNCKRHGLPCVYDRDASSKVSCKGNPVQQLPHGRPVENDPPEGRARRKLEARLMHQYVTETGTSLAIDHHTIDLFSRVIPKLALDSDALLYSMYTVSALHLAKLGWHDEIGVGAENTASTYFSMAVREHNRDVSQVSSETADSVSLTSCLIRVVALVQLQGRDLQPYTPPWQWLALIQTSTSTFVQSLGLTGPDPNSPIIQLIDKTRHIHNNGKLPARGNYQRLQHLMDRPREIQAVEDWDDEIEDVYKSVLDYLCTVLDLLDERGPGPQTLRMLVIFPMLVERRFVELVQEGIPRALVILAHYFAMLASYDDVWWISTIGTDEVRGIASVLSGEWRALDNDKHLPSTASAWLRELERYTLDGVVDKVRTPVFVAAAENDDKCAQVKRLANALGDRATYHFFDATDGAGAHCSLGAVVLTAQVLFDWFENLVSAD